MRALAELADLDWTLTICGDDDIDPDHAAALRALAQTGTLAGRVVFAGACAPDQLERLWQAADIFVSGSHFEGYGMAVAEAVRRGLPLAVTNASAVAEVIPPEGSVPLRRALADAAWRAGRAFPTWADQGRRFAELLSNR